MGFKCKFIYFFYLDVDRVVKIWFCCLVVKLKVDFFLFYMIFDVKFNIDLV